MIQGRLTGRPCFFVCSTQLFFIRKGKNHWHRICHIYWNTLGFFTWLPFLRSRFHHAHR